MVVFWLPTWQKRIRNFYAQHNKNIVSHDVKFIENVFLFVKVETKEEEDIFEFPKHLVNDPSNIEELSPHPTHNYITPHEEVLGSPNQFST